MRPALKAGLLPVWRDRETLQFGVDPRRAIAVGGLGQTAAVLSLLDGSRDRDAVIAAAFAYGVPTEAASHVLAVLAAAGVLDDFPSRLHASLPGQLRARLAPELATASLAYADTDGGARTLARRRAAYVRVHGASRTGACVASFLAASGVGHVSCADPEPAEPADLAPAGLILADLGSPRQEGAARAVERAAPEVRTGEDGSVPDLVILTGPALPDLARQLLRDRVPHLALRTGEAIGVVGPLVRPGRSACLSCVDLRKTEADPQWPKILAQATFTRIQPQACDTVLAAMTATLAAAQALAFLDRPGAVPVTADGTLELVLPDWQWRRRTWPPHPACGCGAALRRAAGDAAAPHEVRDLARLALGVSYARPAAAARWLASAFGFTSPDPLPEANDPLPETGHGHLWIEFRLGDSSLMIFKLDASAAGEGRPAVHTPWVYVDDIDAHYERARTTGATIVTELARPWGLPFYVADDLEGNRWTFAQARPTMR